MRAALGLLLFALPLKQAFAAGLTPAQERFYAAADAAPQRMRAYRPVRERIKRLREDVLKFPGNAERDEEELYGVILPGLSELPMDRQTEVLAFERSRSTLLARLLAAGQTGAGKGKEMSAKLAAIKIGALTVWQPADLAKLAKELDDLLNPPMPDLLALPAGGPDLTGRLSPYEALGKVVTGEQLSSAFDHSAMPASSVLEPPSMMTAPRNMEFGLTMRYAPPPRSAKPAAKGPPQPAGISDKLWNRPLIRKIVRVLDYYGNKLGVYDLLQKAGATDPRAFLLALIKQESNFDPKGPPSSKGAVGLMQVMPGTAADMRIRGDLTDIHVNIRAGLLYLRDALRAFGRLDLALAAYNAGINRVKRARGIPPIEETRSYVKIILRDYAEMMTPTFLQADKF